MAKRPSAKQLAARQRFAEMARAAAAAKRARGTSPTSSRALGPFRGGGGILGLLMAAGATAAWVEGGKMGSRALAQLATRLLKLEATTPANWALAAAVQLGAGYGASWAVERFVSPRRAEDILAGTMLGLLESGIRRFNVPYLAELAGDEGDALMGWTYGLYPVEKLPERELARLAAGAGTAMAMYPGEVGAYVQ